MNPPWTPEADAQLRALYPTHSAIAIGEALGRTRCAIKNRCNKLGLKKPEGTPNSGRFGNGRPSWNKGQKYDSGGRSHATRFQPGHLGGIALQRIVPVGTERLTREGYVQRKVNEDPVFYKRWRFVHVLTWEAAHGPVPKGHVVSLKNGKRDDTRLDNLQLLHRRDIMARNNVHNYPEDLRQVIRLKSSITRKINSISKEQQQ